RDCDPHRSCSVPLARVATSPPRVLRGGAERSERNDWDRRAAAFRSGALGTAGPSIQYSGVVLPPGPNSWPLNIPSACLVPPALPLSLSSAGSVARLPHTAG